MVIPGNCNPYAIPGLFACNCEDTEQLRFVRGDVSRNTEGSGMGLAIAKSFVELQGGNLQIMVDADLFTVEIVFPKP